MIEVKNLTKRYGDRVAVNNISFSVGKGEVLGFLGQNGAGKSTTMKMLTCFMSPTEGTASVAGHDVIDSPLEVKRQIGYLPETPPLYMELLVEEYLGFCADLRGVTRDKRKAAVAAAMEKCQLSEVRRRLIGNLSKGFKQRVGIAQAIVHDPAVLILDEPTIGLDPKQVAHARSLIRGLKQNHTVIYSTHILSEVAATCDRIIVIDKGNIVGQKTLNETAGVSVHRTEFQVMRDPSNLVLTIQGVKGVHKVEAQTQGLKQLVVESEPDENVLAEVAKIIVEHNVGLVRMSPVQHALEEYYLGLISGKRSDR